MRPSSPNNDEIGRQGEIPQARSKRQRNGQIPGGFVDVEAADDIREHIVLLQRYAAVPMQHREHHREAAGVDALGHASWRGEARRIHQSLHFHQQRAGAVTSHHHQAADHRLRCAREEDGGGILHFLEPGLLHQEEAELIGGAEAVLGRTHATEAAARIAFEIEHRVDQMLEHARAGNGAHPW